MRGILSISGLGESVRKKLGMTGHDAQFPYEVVMGDIEVVPMAGDYINITLGDTILFLKVMSRRFIINDGHMNDVFISAGVMREYNNL